MGFRGTNHIISKKNIVFLYPTYIKFFIDASIKRLFMGIIY